MQILQLDIQGTPQRWISKETAAVHYATDSVRWTVGDTCVTLRGGINAASGLQSRIDVHPIIALDGASKVNLFDYVPTLSNRKLWARDRHTCAYCASVFKAEQLTRDHIHPVSRGGRNIWSNVCACCKVCNAKKGAKLLHEAGMKLVYLPYVPSVYEDFILQNRHITADVMEWLSAKLPKNSRLV